jgi:predicted transposase YbfD/YdcC
VVVFCPVRSQESAGDAGDLFAVLDGLPDPRRTRWRRHRLGYVLAVTFSAFTLPGFACLAGAAQWAADESREQLLALGAWPDPFDGRVWPPSEATIRRILTRIDPAALTTACVAWTLARLREQDGAGSEAAEGEMRVRAEQEGTRMATRLKALAMDGKCARGARCADGSMPQFMAAVTHERPVVLAQQQIPDKTSEIRCVASLLTDLQNLGWDLASTVVTLDALHTVCETARQIRATQAHYIMTVKANRADLYTTCATLLLQAEPARLSQHTTTNRGHGRTEERIATTITLTDADGIDFPGAAQIMRIIRYTGGLDGQRTTKEVVYIITSLSVADADTATLATLVRGHWQVENGLHYVRDVTFAEDASHARTGTLPATLATIRNTIIAAFRLAGATNIARARRWAAGAPERVHQLFTTNTNLDISTL